MNAALAALRREIEADGAIALRRLDEAVRRRLEGDGDRALVALATLLAGDLAALDTWLGATAAAD